MRSLRDKIIRLAHANPGQVQEALLPLLVKSAKDLPKDVVRYVQETKEQSPGKEDSYYWAVAWSRYCKHKEPGSPHCKQKSYFPNKGKKQARLESGTLAEDRRKKQSLVSTNGKYYVYTAQNTVEVSVGRAIELFNRMKPLVNIRDAFPSWALGEDEEDEEDWDSHYAAQKQARNGETNAHSPPLFSARGLKSLLKGYGYGVDYTWLDKWEVLFRIHGGVGVDSCRLTIWVDPPDGVSIATLVHQFSKEGPQVEVLHFEDLGPSIFDWAEERFKR